MQAYITDFGESLEVRSVDGSVDDSFLLPRYGVWRWNPWKSRHEVVEVGDDLDKLRSIYGPLQVVPINPPRS